MDKSRITYLTLLTISLILALVCKKKEKGLSIFPFLLGTSLFTEIVTSLLSFYKINYCFVYHFYIPLEYVMWAYYFYAVIDKTFIKKLILFSTPFFIIMCFISSLVVVKNYQLPGFQSNIEGLLLITWATFAIFNIEINKNTGIFARPIFWICVGVLIYYSGSSSFMGVYNVIFKSRPELLNTLRFYLLGVPNYILYTCLSIAFICSLRIKK